MNLCAIRVVVAVVAVAVLMASGADPTLKNAQGQTAEDVAELNDNQEASQAIRVLAGSRAAATQDTGTAKQ